MLKSSISRVVSGRKFDLVYILRGKSLFSFKCEEKLTKITEIFAQYQFSTSLIFDFF